MTKMVKLENCFILAILLEFIGAKRPQQLTLCVRPCFFIYHPSEHLFGSKLNNSVYHFEQLFLIFCLKLFCVLLESKVQSVP